MWNTILEKLNCLKGIDRQFQAFGASTHRYVLYPVASLKAVEATELELGARLPETLRSFYLNVGDGVAGPNYGLNRLGLLKSYRPAEAYPGVATLRQLAKDEGYALDEESAYFELSHDALSGLVAIIEEGCGHRTCLVTTGDSTGNVIYVSADGCVSETRKTMLDVYDEWLNRELERFEAVSRLMLAGYTYEQIDREMVTSYQDHSAGDRIVSIANVQKPTSLFGEGNHRIYHGATQFPWYERTLMDWQRRNRKK